MTLALYDRVQQTGTANTTVSFTLSGSVAGYQSFVAVGNGNTTYYGSFDTSGNWEVGLGTYSTTGPTLTRTTILSSSNGGLAVTFSGTVNVFITYPSEKSVNQDASGNVTLPAGLTVTNDASISGLTVGKGGGSVSTNTAVGYNAGVANTTGNSNIYLGYSAGYSNTTGSKLTALGILSAGTYNLATETFGTTAVGYYAGATLTTGHDNVFVGSYAGTAGGAGSSNVAVGAASLYNTTASNNTAVGYQAGYTNTTGDKLTAIGYQAGYNHAASGSLNTFVGYAAGLGVTTANSVTCIGSRTGNATMTGGENTLVGDIAGYSITSGSGNSFIGKGSGQNHTTGTNCVAVGVQSLYSNTTASYNTAVGYQAGYTNQTGTYNTFYGYQAGYSYSGTGNSSNICIGAQAGYSLTTGTGNTFVGPPAGYLITTGSKNTIIGAYLGNSGGLDIRTASNYIVLSDGDGTIGYVYANGSSFFGTTPSSYGGNGAVTVVSNGSVRPQIRTYDTDSAANTNNAWSIFRNGSQVGAVQTTLSTTLFVNLSDYRLKENVAPMTGALAKVSQLKPVTYDWKVGGTGQGFIAHELQSVFPDAVTGEKDAIDEESKPVYQGIDTSFLVATLVSAVQELKAEIDQLKGK